MSAEIDRLIPISDLLLGAAYSDDHLHEREKQKVTELLAQLLDQPQLPQSLVSWINAFDNAAFDLKSSCREFADDPATSRKHLLQLICAVHDADDEFDLAEDEYTRNVAKALGIADAELAEFTVSYEVEDLRDSLDCARKSPPPIPRAGTDSIDVDVD